MKPVVVRNIKRADPNAIGTLAAVGVSTFGIPFEDRVELAPAIDGWDKLAMGRELRAAFAGAQIRMATDAKAAAQAADWRCWSSCFRKVLPAESQAMSAAWLIAA